VTDYPTRVRLRRNTHAARTCQTGPDGYSRTACGLWVSHKRATNTWLPDAAAVTCQPCARRAKQ
jgi:hypothetical protein